ncbi:hypothetical protein SETIT_3G287700v2 [Setaria italica]|uniref:Uncharacterized protein n=1 Tax=Setaria italica TaxID=4555 RepID=A0A368QLY7_SETIT|nr:hypothetical protein SETIT_3G287700v2 [Setaria italica]
MAANDQQPLHILFFPQVAAGHLIPVADMANLFSSRGVKCTILTTPKNAAVIRLAVDQAANGASGGTGFPAIDISTVPFPDVGLPPSFESIADLTSQADKGKLVDALHRLCEPLDRFLAEHRPDAVVVDSFLVIPPPSTTMFARASNDSLLRNNPLELAPDDPDAGVSLPGLPHRVALRRSQMMDPRTNELEWNYYQRVNVADQRSYGEIFNSFAELELETGAARAGAGGLAPEAERCLRWLDEKPEGSVVYVSFGTLTHFTVAELREGLIFRGWALQRLILDHSAIGGFVTHCGWISVLEAVSAGVPLVTWPRYADQFYNAKLVLEVLKIGVGVGSRVYASKLEVRGEVISGEKIAEAIDGVMGCWAVFLVARRGEC